MGYIYVHDHGLVCLSYCKNVEYKPSSFNFLCCVTCVTVAKLGAFENFTQNVHCTYTGLLTLSPSFVLECSCDESFNEKRQNNNPMNFPNLYIESMCNIYQN